MIPTRIRTSLVLMAAFVTILLGAFMIASQTAYANEFPAWDMKTVTAPGPSFATCPNLKDWAPNTDEDDRWPTATVDGLAFSNTDLVHHEADVALADLKPGSYVASPAPDQPSFFSVEVTDPDGAYGTLRWNPTEGTSGEWDLTTNLDQFHKADPADYIGVATKWGTFTDKARVFSFGVGDTMNPASEVTTVVSSVTFGGHVYDLTCQPKTETSSPAPHTSSTSPAPHTSKSSSHAPGAAAGSGTDGGALAITGSNVSTRLFIAAGLLAAGAVVIWLVRRRRVRFTA